MIQLFNTSALNNKQRFYQAILYGTATAILCTIAITLIVSSIQIVSSWFYILSAYAISTVIRKMGRGVTRKFSILGAVLTVLCILFSETFIRYGFSILLDPSAYGAMFMSFFYIFRIDNIMDILMVMFQAASVYIGYTNSIIV